MKRRGFTLIELMVVIAIIIILAAIAIPNYLSMTARAKRSRVASDFAALATALESYRTDWNQYPIAAANGECINDTVTPTAVSEQLDGLAGTQPALVANLNWGSTTTGSTTAAGDKAPIQYMTPVILGSMKNAYTGNLDYLYISDGTGWTLKAPTAGVAGVAHLVRTNTSTTLTDSAS